MSWRLSAIIVCCALSGSRAGVAAAQPLPVDIGQEAPPSTVIAVDADDDDEDGTPDGAQSSEIPEEDLVALSIARPRGMTLRTEGSVRLVVGGVAQSGGVAAPANGIVHVQGLAASRSAGDSAVVAERDGVEARIPFTVVAVSFLSPDNERLSAARDALGVSHAVTNDRSLARATGYRQSSPDSHDVRVELFDSGSSDDQIEAWLEAWAPGASTPRSRRRITLSRPGRRLPFRSSFLRLVGDTIDEQAPGVGERVLVVGLRDHVRIRYPLERGRAVQSIRVGRPGDEDGPHAARRARVRVHVMRHAGVPAVGSDDRGALRIAREQISIANEVWIQCAVTFGTPEEAEIEIVDAPPPSLLAFGDRDGLPARGGGEIRFRAGGRVIGPVSTRPDASPLDTALRVARALRAAGFVPEVTTNASTEFGAGPSADILLRDGAGALVELSADGTTPLSTDHRQSVQIGRVGLADGLQEFDNMTAAAGSLEERAMIKALGDDDPSSIDLFVVNHFSGGTRQGEAFIESDGGSVVNTILLDRNGIRQQREAWTQSHEIGHVLLDHPFHPDNIGPDRPWLLMDADSSLGLVTGPKRLTVEECARARARSGVSASPAMLERFDARPRTPSTQPPLDLGYATD